MTFPALVCDLIPASTLDITLGDVDTAKRIVAERRGQLNARSQDRETATRELQKLAAAQRLDQRRSPADSLAAQALATYRTLQDAKKVPSMLAQDQLRDRCQPACCQPQPRQ